MARQNFIGLVVSQGRMNKTVKVRVQTKSYEKTIKKEVLNRKDYLVHDEGNLCKEGDIVRIEAIPKMTSRKYFAIAEIKVNKGSQFELYEKVAKEKVAAENEQKIAEFLERRTQIESIITKLDDLKQIDKISKSLRGALEKTREDLIKQIDEIKAKYDIPNWPTTQPVVDFAINEATRDLLVMENRLTNLSPILAKLMSEEFSEQRKLMLQQVTRGKYEDVEAILKAAQKNLLRKFVMDPQNEVPNVI